MMRVLVRVRVHASARALRKNSTISEVHMKQVALAVLALLPLHVASSADDVGKSGQELYERYCASCHGVSGRGDGPVAASLKVEVPDLTRFAQRRGNYFDRDLVERVIDGRHVIGAHGTRTMPVWGEVLAQPQLGNPDAERATRVVIARLADYLWQLQHAGPGRTDDR
jgi:mono/diheme cytochrome c family protein